ncbi:cyclophilin-like protein [Lophium mytilinum]|uniref:Peptidyl-prolyl cis-trans isomerase n=1 Tax=Lophium mytilinum TaxID=390894 RepID=A0A6A6QQ78_9PEZI|nr:cyclophilin-like protein [Lophium mytilinum]
MSVLLETSVGDIVIDLLVTESPRCCENFLKLCKIKYYNFSPVHSVQPNFSFQTGDPIGPGSKDSDGGSSIWGLLSPNDPAKKTFKPEFHPKLKHVERGTVSLATAPAPNDPDERLAGSQFIVTLGDNLDYLDGKAAIFGTVVEGFDALEKINTAFVDESGRPLKDIRIRHTVVLDDPFPDPPGLTAPDASPVPTPAQLATVRIADDEEFAEEEDQEAMEALRREREARAQALTLEMMGDLPFAEVKPPENVLFVCKLNPVTQDEDLELIFSRFGKILSCEVIRDKRTGDSLQYAFVEFEEKKDCENAYFKMDGVLIDDHRIHVDFSQSVSRLSDSWRDATNAKRKRQGGGFGGIESLERKRQYRVDDGAERQRERERENKYGIVMDREAATRREEASKDFENSRKRKERSSEYEDRWRPSRSRSPKRSDRRDRDSRYSEKRRERSRSRSRDRYRDDHRRRDRSRERYRDGRRRDRDRR